MENKPKSYNFGDYCLLTSLWIYSMLDTKAFNEDTGETTDGIKALVAFEAMEKECKLDPLSLFPIKSEEYTWSRSDGLTRWLYDNILKYFGINPGKGLNFDQLRGYYLFLYRTKRRKKACKHLLSWIARLGFAPSLMEHVFFKPQALVMMLATIWKPLHYLVWPFLYFSVKKNFEETIEQGTTNKITLIPTLMELGYLEVAEDFIFIKIGRYHRAFHKSWVERVYDVYFCQEDNKFIGIAMKEALL